ncbi:MAG: small, acid-soluble spore protein, alpha/beta type [Lachnospiraceae bacterium]
MGKKKEKKIDLNNLTPEEKLKLEIAEEIGVYDKVLQDGWRCLSAKESGRIGGLMTKRKKAIKAEALKEDNLELK